MQFPHIVQPVKATAATVYDPDGHLVPASSKFPETTLIKAPASTIAFMISSNCIEEQTIAMLILWAYYCNNTTSSAQEVTYFPDNFLDILQEGGLDILKPTKQMPVPSKKAFKTDTKSNRRKTSTVNQLDRLDRLQNISMFRPISLEITTATLSSEGILRSTICFLSHVDENIRFLAAKVFVYYEFRLFIYSLNN
jgi:hypothetical protein